VEASTETAATINGLPTHINMLSTNTFADFSTTTNTGFGILTSTTFAGFEVLTSTTQSGFASVNTGLNDLSSATISGFNILTIKTAHASFGFNKAEPKVEEAKGIEYYILDDRLVLLIVRIRLRLTCKGRESIVIEKVQNRIWKTERIKFVPFYNLKSKFLIKAKSFLILFVYRDLF